MSAEKYLKMAEAAEYLRCSVRHFKRHILPCLVPIENGSILLFTREELDLWADRARRGASENPEEPTTRALSALRTRRAALAKSPQARAMLSKLRVLPQKSTRDTDAPPPSTDRASAHS